MRAKYKKIRLDRKTTMDEHRFLVEVYLERKLDSCEVVHHCNGNTCDNRLENLDINLLSKHSSFHLKGRKVSKATRKKLSDALCGENAPHAKLNESQVRNIRRRIKSGEKYRDVAKDFPISFQYISDIVNGKCWSHII